MAILTCFLLSFPVWPFDSTYSDAGHFLLAETNIFMVYSSTVEISTAVSFNVSFSLRIWFIVRGLFFCLHNVRPEFVSLMVSQWQTLDRSGSSNISSSINITALQFGLCNLRQGPLMQHSWPKGHRSVTPLTWVIVVLNPTTDATANL